MRHGWGRHMQRVHPCVSLRAACAGRLAHGAMDIPGEGDGPPQRTLHAACADDLGATSKDRDTLDRRTL